MTGDNDKEKCTCHGAASATRCPRCGGEELFTFWCEACRQPVAEKRCPLCGLKARRLRPGDLAGQ